MRLVRATDHGTARALVVRTSRAITTGGESRPQCGLLLGRVNKLRSVAHWQPPHQRHPPVPGRYRDHRGMVAVATTAHDKTLAGCRIGRRHPGMGRIVHPNGEGWIRHIFGGFRLPVRTVGQCLLHAHRNRPGKWHGLANHADPAVVVVQHRRSRL